MLMYLIVKLSLLSLLSQLLRPPCAYEGGSTGLFIEAVIWCRLIVQFTREDTPVDKKGRRQIVFQGQGNVNKSRSTKETKVA